MKYIALVAVAAVLLLEFSGAVPKSSVGGAMTIALAFLLAAIAVGLHEAWTEKRSVLGWIVSIIAAVVGGFIAANLGALIMDMIMPVMRMDTSLAASRHPLLYISLAGMMLLTLAGARAGLWAVNRLR